MDKELKLEPTLERNGRIMPRCQATSQRKGTQCTQAARRGYRVCHMHGAGTKKRVETGERNPVGRPPIHGLYSKQARTDIQELSEQVYLTEGALENSDRELALLKGTLWFLANSSETFVGKVELFESAAEQLQSVLENFVVVRPRREAGGNEDTAGRGEMTPEDARTIGKDIATCFKLITALESWVKLLADVNAKTITAHKVRAETAGKLAETKALAEFGRLLQLVRNVVVEMSPDDEFLDSFEARLKRELYGPLNLEVPELGVKPDDLN